MFCCVRGYGGRRAWRTTLSPTRWTPFLFRPLYAWLVWCWPACVWSVYGHVVAAAVVLLVHGCVSRLMVGVFGVGSLALLRALARSDVVRVVVLLVSVLVGRARVRLRLGLCCLLGRGWCCAGSWPPSWWGLLRWCVAPPMVGHAVLVRASRPLWGVLCRCVVPPKVGAALACGPPHCRHAALLRGPPRGGACPAGAWPPSCWGTLCWCLSAAVVVRGVVVVGLGCRRVCHLGAGVGFGLVVLVVLFEPAPCAACFVCSVLYSPPYCRRVRMGVVGGWIAVVVVLITWAGRLLCWCAAPHNGWAYCVGACPPPPWWRVLRWVVAPFVVGRAVLVRAPPLAGVCCVGAPLPRWWCLVWVVVACWVGCGCGCVVDLAGVGAVLVRAPPSPPVGACRVCAWPPPWWGLLCRRVPVSVRGVVGGWMLGLFCWFAVVPVAVPPELSGVCCLWSLRGRGRCCVGACPPLCWGVPCLCVAPPLVGPAVSACSGFGSWCCSRLDARLVLLVCCCLRRRTVGVVGCCLSVVFSWLGRIHRPPERVWCATPLSWPGRTGRPPERVRCAPLLVFGSRVLSPCCSWSFARSCLCGSWPCAGVCSPLAAVPPPPHPTPPFRLLCPAPPSLLGAPAGGSPPPPRGYALPDWLSRPRLPLLPLCLVVGRLLAFPFAPPPPDRVSWVLAPAARFPLSSCFCLVFSVLLAWAPVWLGFVFPPRLVLVPPSPPAVAPGGLRCPASCSVVLWLGVGCCVRRAVFCCAVLCCCAGALLCGALVCCAVGRLPLALATSFLLLSLGAPLLCAVLCGVSSCVVPSCVGVCCGVFLVALWCRGCSLSALSVLRTCGSAPPGVAPTPPPPWFVCRTFCRFVLPRCAGLFCPFWCRVAACCVVLFGVRCAVSCCAVSCCAPRVAWCCAAFPRAAASCCVLCRARWCCAVLSCVAPFAGVLRPGALCCAVPLCAVVGCFVPSGVRWRCAVGCVLCCAVVCCFVLCCAFGRGVWLRCAVLSSLWLAVSLWSRCPVLCCASWCCVGPCRVVLCCVVLCCVVVPCAVRWGAASWCSVLCCPTVCCRGLLCAVWCLSALCGWLRAVPRCCLLPCAVLRLWAWCLVALCCAVLVVACCFVLVALPCSVLCCASWCCVGPCRVVLCCVVLCCCAPRCGGGTVLRCLAVCGAASRCGVPSGAVRCLGCCVLCCVLCCAAVFCAVPGGVVSWCAVLLCTALWGWHCAALSRGLWCRFPLWRALGCCAVPRVLCALLRAVLCCCVLCCAWGCGVLVRCAVLFASCLAVWSGSVFLCGVLCLLVLFCSALHLVVSCGVVLLRTVLFAWCCAVFARVFWCWCVLCLALGCCAALWGAVPFGAVLCCGALCCARCAVCVLPLCCRVCCFCCCPLCCQRPVVLPSCIFKTRKNCFLF